MGKKSLNQDYFKLNGRNMRKSPPDEQIDKISNVRKGNIKKPISAKKDVGIEKI